MQKIVATAAIPGCEFRVVDEGDGVLRYSVEVFQSGEVGAAWDSTGTYYTTEGHACVAMARQITLRAANLLGL